MDKFGEIFVLTNQPESLFLPKLIFFLPCFVIFKINSLTHFHLYDVHIFDRFNLDKTVAEFLFIHISTIKLNSLELDSSRSKTYNFVAYFLTQFIK